LPSLAGKCVSGGRLNLQKALDSRGNGAHLGRPAASIEVR
jgi:hypothetical protein